MKRVYFFLIISLYLVIVTISAGAGIIYEQLPGNSPDGTSTIFYSDSGLGYRAADDFVLDSTQTITDIHWWGVENEVVNNFDFTFYTDNSGIPGTPLLTTGGSLSTESVNVGSNFDPLTYYSTFLDTPFNAIGGTIYWLSIFNQTSGFSWHQAVTNNGSFAQSMEYPSGTTWNTIRSLDVAFRLTDDVAPVPEPTTMLLLGTGLVGVAGAARRRKMNQA